MDPVTPKHPGSSQVYTVNWARSLNPAAIVTVSTWTVPTGITKVTDAIVSGGLSTSIQLSGGLDGTDYRLVNTVTTSDGETLVADCPLLVRRS